jgi:hypothetical protein
MDGSCAVGAVCRSDGLGGVSIWTLGTDTGALWRFINTGACARVTGASVRLVGLDACVCRGVLLIGIRRVESIPLVRSM